MENKSSIKRGVSLYSFQEEYFLRKLSLEDCIAKAASMGAYGIEIIGEQMVPGFPKLTDSFLEQWFGWMKKYGTTPICHNIKGEFFHRKSNCNPSFVIYNLQINWVVK
jgi:sugar phosphate isomerase/epimerase